jgi:threonine synthase
MPGLDFYYVCSECGQFYPITPEVMVCPDCARKQQADRPLRGVLEVAFEGEMDHYKPWDVHDLLPVEKTFFPKMPIGFTPLWDVGAILHDRPALVGQPQRAAPTGATLTNPDAVGATLSGRPALTRHAHLYIKDDTLNPTGSLKDRASVLVAAFARQHGIQDIVVASTGNAASSMAGVGAAAGLNVTLFVPKSAPRAKLVQALQYGARVVLVDGNYDRAYELSLEYSRRKGYLSRNTAYNPLTIEGKKTVAVEIFGQLAQAPDYVFVPTGDGVILAGVYKGFRDLMQIGMIPKVPTVYAVQAEGSSGMARAFQTGDFGPPIPARTVADSISVDVPRNGYHALKQLKTYGGRCITVSDEAILQAQHWLASSTGLFAEPSAAASLAGFLSCQADIPADATVVLLVTGNGLKDIDAAMRLVSLPERAIASVDEIE